MKRAILVYLMLCLVVTICIEAKKKPFGDGLYWELTDDGTLTISGFGTMPNYGFINSKYSGQKKFEKRPWHKNSQDIIKIIIEYGVTTIGDGIFYECKNLKSAEIANSVETIGEWAFYGCGMESIVLPNSVTSIKGVAFGQCENLTTIVIPNSVISIGRVVFSGCKSLKEIQIPNSVTELGGHAFDGCVSLTSITIPSSISVIEDNLFDNCTNLVSVILPNTIKEIQDYAFNGCDNLRRLYIPRSVTKVGEYAFARKASWYEHKLYNPFDGEIMSMPDFMLNGDPAQWGLSQKSVDAYKYGIRDDSGKLLRSGRKGWKITKLHNGKIIFYVVEDNNIKGLLNGKGDWIIPISDSQYSDYISAGGNFLKVKSNSFYGVITEKGDVVIPISRGYTYIDNYDSNKRTFAFTKKGLRGTCDAQGREISTTRLAPTADDIKTDGGYGSAVAMNNGSTKYYKVSKGGRYGLTDSEGGEIIPCEMEALESAGTGYLKYKINGFWGVMNYTGKIIIDTDRGYTSIGNFVTFTKRFPYTMAGYKGECDINGRQISKIKVNTPQQTVATSSSSSNSSSSSSSSSSNNSGGGTTKIVVEHQHSPQPVQQWQACIGCGGMGTMGCDFCGGSGTRYVGDNLRRCSRCNGRGIIPCNVCYGNKGQYITVYR